AGRCTVRSRQPGRYGDRSRHAQRSTGCSRAPAAGDEERTGSYAMMLRFALRSLAIRPIKTIVLAFGFGLGVAVMAILLGIGEVILEQAHSPALQGGGDVAVAGAFGPVDNARFVLSSVLGAGDLRPRAAAMSPSRRSTLYLIAPDKVWAIAA